MPRLSVILPAYGVEAFLPECLASLCAATAADGEVELIGVDDRSPDACGAILDAHAARDPRLRVLHLASNAGLGGAREAGLAEASGRYVWFVDTDDRLPDGALDAVLAELRLEDEGVAGGQAPLDVLLTDFTHLYSDGSTEPNPWRHALAGSPLEAGATAADHPALFSSVLTVWNKVIRREFLLGLGVAFGRGWYEDISVTYPALLAARRLRYLDTPCYTYRRGRPGAITATASPRHTEVFAQYDAVFAFADRHRSADALRTVVFDRTVRHALTTYDTPGLVPDALRGEFFARVADHIRRHRPPGYRFPPGPRGAQYLLAAHGSRQAYDAVRTAKRAAAAALPPARRVARRAARTAARTAASAAYRRLPLDENLAVYAAYWHRGYACNPAAIYAKARELAPHIRGVWVVADAARAAALPPGVPYVVVNTPAYLKAMATAKYRVNNVNWASTSGKRPGSVHVQTQHGTPLKTMGLDQRAYPATCDGMDFDRLAANVARWDHLLSPNPYTSEVWRSAYPGPYELLELGYPRNDRLVTATAGECAGVRAALGLGAGRRVALYAPTHRGASAGYVPLLDLAGLAERLGSGWTVLVRAHYFHGGGVGEADGDGDGAGAAALVDVSDHGCVEDLYLAADALVTDYSSTMFDYALLDRPVVVFAPDWELYRATRGVYFDLLAAPPGAVATTTDELADALLAGDPAPAARAAFRARFCPWDDGHAAERVVRRVFGLP